MNLPTCDRDAIEQFSVWLNRAKMGEVLDPPLHLISGDAEGYSSTIEIDKTRTFRRRWDVAEYYRSVFGNRSDWNRFLTDRGSLVACTIIHFSSLCKRKPDGTWEIRKDTKAADPEDQFPNYIPLSGERRFYRHRIRGPMVVFDVGGEHSRAMLYGPAYQHGDFMEQMTGRPDLFLTPSIIELTYRLYWNTHTNRPHRGWSSTDKPRPDGVLRRLIGPESFLEAHSWTYDYMSMTADQLVEMLPDEFEYWLAQGQVE